MSRAEKTANLAGVIVPFVGVLAAVVLLWNSWVDAVDLGLLAAFYVLTAAGVTVGFHRLLTHRSFRTRPWLEHTFAVLGSMSVQGSVLDWVADHRKHHAHTDDEGDPHSPARRPRQRARRPLARPHGLADRDAGPGRLEAVRPRALRGPGDAHDRPAVPAARARRLLLPTLAGFALHGWTLEGAVRGYVWGGLVRIFLVHHVTWSINSVCHFFGRRRFDVEDRSTNVAWLALPSLGESWHHNHHAFPRSAEHGLRWWEFDPSALIIRALEKLGLARTWCASRPSAAGRLA